MIRVSGLRRQLAANVVETPPDGMSPAEQLMAIRQTLLPMLEQHAASWNEDIKPKLNEEGIQVLGNDELKNKQRKLLRRYFEREIFPALTPLAFDPGHPFPHISNLSLNLAVVLNDPRLGERFARLKVPALFPRLIRIPSEEKAESYESSGFGRGHIHQLCVAGRGGRRQFGHALPWHGDRGCLSFPCDPRCRPGD